MLDRIITTAVAIVAAVTGVAVPTMAGTPGCATHGEWDQLETFMRPMTVADLLDTNGEFLSENAEVFRRSYDVCWDSSRIGVVRYDQTSGFSVSWNVRDR